MQASFTDHSPNSQIRPANNLLLFLSILSPSPTPPAPCMVTETDRIQPTLLTAIHIHTSSSYTSCPRHFSYFRPALPAFQKGPCPVDFLNIAHTYISPQSDTAIVPITLYSEQYLSFYAAPHRQTPYSIPVPHIPCVLCKRRRHNCAPPERPRHAPTLLISQLAQSCSLSTLLDTPTAEPCWCNRQMHDDSLSSEYPNIRTSKTANTVTFPVAIKSQKTRAACPRPMASSHCGRT